MEQIITYTLFLYTAKILSDTTPKVRITEMFVTLGLQITFQSQYLGARGVNFRVEFDIIGSSGSSVIAFN
jgi:hypothetical protein